MFIRPKEGLIVRDPKTMVPLPQEGKKVVSHKDYWIRRLRDGDVELDNKQEADSGSN